MVALLTLESKIMERKKMLFPVLGFKYNNWNLLNNLSFQFNLYVCVCRETEKDQSELYIYQNVSIIIWHQILESIVHRHKIHSEFTIQSVNRETWWGADSDVLHCFVFFTQNFPDPLKLSSLGHCSCAVAHIPLAQSWNGMLGMSPPSKIFLDQAYPFS